MCHMGDEQRPRFLPPRILLIVHGLLVLYIVIWARLGDTAAPAVVELAWSMLPRTVGGYLAVLVFAWTVLLFPVAALVVMWFVGARRGAPYLASHCVLSTLQWVGLVPLLA